jgi:hypothetical protein
MVIGVANNVNDYNMILYFKFNESYATMFLLK